MIFKQKIIVSDEDIESAKKCVLYLKHQIFKLSEVKYQEQENNQLKVDSRKKSNPVWIPYGPILGEVFPAEKGPDMRISTKIIFFSEYYSSSKDGL